MKKLTLGTSGFVYKTTGRKGEDLIKRLSEDELIKSLNLNLVASGQGWPIKTKDYKWDDIQDFYHSLDMYLSTSVVEGFGYGVIEALACGIPVIIPNDVGIYDELPDLVNIYRYHKGDYAHMVRAIEQCVKDIQEGKVYPNDLREATNKFNANNWANSHIDIFQNMCYNKELVGISDNNNMGIYTIAYGKEARECFKRLLESVHKYLPDIPVCVVSDKPIETKLKYIYVEYPDKDIGARNNKTMIYDLAPQNWEYILYLDADTEVVSYDVIFLFDILKDGFEFAICINPAQYVLVKNMIRPDNKQEMSELIELLGTDELIQVNGGVFSFRRTPNTQYLMQGWNKEWQKYGKRDQAALDRVLFDKPLRLYVLGNEWNTVTRYLEPERTAGILHYPMEARRWKGRIEGRLDASEAWASVHPESRLK